MRYSKINKKFCYIISLLIFYCFTFIQLSGRNSPYIDSLKEEESKWVDSVFLSLSPEERIAQLFMVAAYSNRDTQHTNEITDLICEYNIGGLIFFKGGPVRQATLTNYYQSIAKTPLLIAMDAEWGLSMRLDSTIRFPKQMSLGVIQNDDLIYEMGTEIAKQCKRLGVHVNLAPVIDINTNPLNPVINNRSFGEDKYSVARKGIAYMKGLQDNGVIASAKHFPGHGDTDIDSHLALPIIKHTRLHIDSLELYPFKELINAGIASVMIAHLYIPSYDSTPNLASTLSKNVVTDLLKNKMGFKGLVFTDALNMKGVSAFNEPGTLDLKALLAGNDILLFSENVTKAIEEIQNAIKCELITQTDIDERVKKILKAKYWAGLYKPQYIETKNLIEDLNTPEAKLLSLKLYESSLTLLKNNDNLIPFKKLDTLRFASLVIGDSLDNVFQQNLSYYAPVDHYQIEKKASLGKIDTMLRKLSAYNMVIVGIHNTSINSLKNYGITEQEVALLNALEQRTKVALVLFGNAYTLSKLIGAEDADVLLMAYEDMPTTHNLSAQLLFGGVDARGKLPVTASLDFKLNEGLTTSAIRLKYTFPEEVGLHSKDLEKIDSLAIDAIIKKATPGCQILVAKDNRVIYHKSFGYHTYDSINQVKNSDIYDIASVTKIVGVGLGIMHLYDQECIELDKKVSKYLPELKSSDKNKILLREMLAHQAGLQSWIPFWMNTMDKDSLSHLIYRGIPSDSFSVKIAENLYIRNDYADSIWLQILNSPINPASKYIYSDLGPIISKKIVERISCQRLDSLLYKKFYSPLGLSTLTYLPRNRFDLSRIVPTEYDAKFRRQLIHGYVHDPAAAMLGGIAGNAGIFSNANDLAIIMQMLLQNGYYGDERYLKEETIKEFTRQQFPECNNRRGLIFDKAEVDTSKNGPTAQSASCETFGHSGFTGTGVWVDPEYNLIYVFLSNRVYPNADNNMLVDMNVRTEIQQVIYNAIKNHKLNKIEMSNNIE